MSQRQQFAARRVAKLVIFSLIAHQIRSSSYSIPCIFYPCLFFTLNSSVIIVYINCA
jgi:hypothetical protein